MFLDSVKIDAKVAAVNEHCLPVCMYILMYSDNGSIPIAALNQVREMLSMITSQHSHLHISVTSFTCFCRHNDNKGRAKPLADAALQLLQQIGFLRCTP